MLAVSPYGIQNITRAEKVRQTLKGRHEKDRQGQSAIFYSEKDIPSQPAESLPFFTVFHSSSLYLSILFPPGLCTVKLFTVVIIVVS